MSANYIGVPLGIRVIQRCSSGQRSDKVFRTYKFSVLILTFLSYMCYHMTRTPISVAKTVWHRNCSLVKIPEHVQPATISSNDSTWCNYPPFDGSDSATLFGTMDTTFVLAYGIAMFGAGFVAERVSIRYFLTLGMMLTAICTYLLGIAKIYDIHSIWYFLIIQAFAGVFQSTGWPGVVTALGNWFGKSHRGFIMGVWNSHTSFGNIVGTLVSGHFVESDWSMSFIMPALIMSVTASIIFLFLVESPKIVDCKESEANQQRPTNANNNCPSLGNSIAESIDTRCQSTASLTKKKHTAIGFVDALKLPGVIEFSLCLFFAKLVCYTFLYWLPKYIDSSTTLGPEDSAKLATLFDVGGIFGGILAGMISDYSERSASTCSIMLALAIPMLLVYRVYGTVTYLINVILLFILGVLVNGPYALITTSVCAELSQRSYLEQNSKALATVTAIIDGTGSLGGAVGPLLAGYFSTTGWQNVFYMLMMADVLALVLLLRLVFKEISKFRSGSGENQQHV